MGKEIATLILFLQGVFAAFGLIDNSYIVVLICKGLSTGRNLTPNERFVVSLSFINLGILIITVIYSICSYGWPEICHINSVAQVFVVAFMFMNSSSLWISTWLCVYRSIKLANGQQKLFKRIKLDIAGMVPWMIIASVVVAMGQTFIIPKDMYITYANRSDIVFSSKCSYCTLWINFAFSSIGFYIFILATVAILRSLCSHVKTMEKNASISSKPRLVKLFTAARMVSLLFLTCIIFYVAQCLILINVAKYRSIPFMICILFITIYPALNAIILIMGDRKLKVPVMNLLMQIRGKYGSWATIVCLLFWIII